MAQNNLSIKISVFIASLLCLVGCELPPPTNLLSVKGFVGCVPQSYDTTGITEGPTAYVFLQRHTYSGPSNEPEFSNVWDADVILVSSGDTFQLPLWGWGSGIYYLDKSIDSTFYLFPGNSYKVIIKTPQEECLIYSMRLPEYSLRITEPPYGTSIPQDTIIEIRWRYEGEDTFPKVQWGLKRWEARRIEYNVTSIPSNERKWKLAFTGLTNYETQVGIIGGKAGILEKGAEYNYNHTTYAHPEPEIIGVAGQVIKLTIALKKERI